MRSVLFLAALALAAVVAPTPAAALRPRLTAAQTAQVAELDAALAARATERRDAVRAVRRAALKPFNAAWRARIAEVKAQRRDAKKDVLAKVSVKVDEITEQYKDDIAAIKAKRSALLLGWEKSIQAGDIPAGREDVVTRP
jgi:small-conductance mechanosensitive channel